MSVIDEASGTKSAHLHKIASNLLLGTPSEQEGAHEAFFKEPRSAPRAWRAARISSYKELLLLLLSREKELGPVRDGIARNALELIDYTSVEQAERFIRALTIRNGFV